MKILLNNSVICECEAERHDEIAKRISDITLLQPTEFFILQDGKRFFSGFASESDLYCCLRINGGKGGFGSMLRAIGAQIEKTTNREACRDLSGRRLRDINEEKRLKAWVEKQAEREKEAEEKKKRKIAKLLAVPKHDFKDEEYEEARSKLTEKVSDAVEEGFKKTQVAKKTADVENPEPSTSKRKAESKATNVVKSKKKKSALWIGDDISDCDSDSSESEEDIKNVKAIKA